MWERDAKIARIVIMESVRTIFGFTNLNFVISGGEDINSAVDLRILKLSLGHFVLIRGRGRSGPK